MTGRWQMELRVKRDVRERCSIRCGCWLPASNSVESGAKQHCLLLQLLS